MFCLLHHSDIDPVLLGLDIINPFSGIAANQIIYIKISLHYISYFLFEISNWQFYILFQSIHFTVFRLVTLSFWSPKGLLRLYDYHYIETPAFSLQHNFNRLMLSGMNYCRNTLSHVLKRKCLMLLQILHWCFCYWHHCSE